MSIKNAVELAMRKFALDEECLKATRKLAQGAESMGDDEFWPLVEILAGNIHSRRGNVKEGCHNFMCYEVYYKTPSLPAWERMCSFAKKYAEVKALLSKKCFDMPGIDDSHGDLMDSLPLAGRAVFAGIMEDDIANYKQLKRALDDCPLNKFILDGENYVEMTLNGKVEKTFLSVAMDLSENGE